MSQVSARADSAGGILPTVVPPVLALGVVLGCWQGATAWLKIPAYLLPPPSAVVVAAWRAGPQLLEATATTGAEAAVGFFLSALLGVALATLFARVPWLARASWPYAIFLQTVPIVAVAPLLVIWFGAGFKAVAVASGVVSLFPVLASSLAGLRATPPDLLELMQVYGATPRQIFFKLKAPAALPFAAAGLKSAGGLAVVGAVVGEMVAGTSGGRLGLGYLVVATYRQLKTAELFAAIIASAGLGLIFFALTSGLSWLALRRWHGEGMGNP